MEANWFTFFEVFKLFDSPEWPHLKLNLDVCFFLGYNANSFFVQLSQQLDILKEFKCF